LPFPGVIWLGYGITFTGFVGSFGVVQANASSKIKQEMYFIFLGINKTGVCF